MAQRKTKREREQARAEEAEQLRRLRDGEPIGVLRNPNVVLPDPEAVAAVREHDRALRELVRASSRPEPAPERARCPKHPEWRPRRAFADAPLPAASECP